jgi:hypothetical protein
MVVVGCEPKLFQVVFALRAAGGFTSLLHSGQQQCNQNGDDRDHHQQFDQRKTTPIRPKYGARIPFHEKLLQKEKKNQERQHTGNRSHECDRDQATMEFRRPKLKLQAFQHAATEVAYEDGHNPSDWPHLPIEEMISKLEREHSMVFRENSAKDRGSRHSPEPRSEDRGTAVALVCWLGGQRRRSRQATVRGLLFGGRRSHLGGRCGGVTRSAAADYSTKQQQKTQGQSHWKTLLQI